MRRIIMLATAVALLSGAAGAQAPAPGEPSATPKLNITLEHRHTIKEIIKSLNVPPAPAEADLSVGAVARSGNLQPIPADVAAKVPQIKSHLFFVKDGKIAIVDPRENRIAEVID